jgi:metal-sulfur cluster biosynthetic enzyme
MSSHDAIRAAVARAIAEVDDPCSIAANAPLNIFELGLVRSWDVDDDGHAQVVVSPTAPSCTLMGSILQGIEQRVGALAGVTDVDVIIDTDFVWSPAEMTAAGRAQLAARRTGSMARVPVRPRQWRDGPPSSLSAVTAASELR